MARNYLGRVVVTKLRLGHRDSVKHHVEDRSSEEGLVRGRGRGVDRVNGPYLRIDRRRPKDVAKAMIDSVTRWRDSSNIGRQPTKGAARHCMYA